MVYELASDSGIRYLAQFLAIIGGIILVALARKVKDKRTRYWMYIIGGGTAIADALFLVLT